MLLETIGFWALYQKVAIALWIAVPGKVLLNAYENEGKNSNTIKLNRAYNRLLRKRKKTLIVWGDCGGGDGTICEVKITKDNKELIRECLKTHDWDKVFKNGYVNTTNYYEYIIDQYGNLSLFYENKY